jgi:hypothetical protein
MAALLFPDAPTPGQLYPVNPGTSGVTQYRWNNTKGVWNAVFSTVSLGSPNQGAYNDYAWPLADGAPDQQLTTDGSGNLTWEVPAAPSLQILTVDRAFNGTDLAYTLWAYGTTTPFSPIPSENIVVFLGGVPQVPGAAYGVAGSTITFTEAPLAGTTFYAISNVIA